GSGGARGYAHIGVIEELLTHGYEIKSISGSSMGALIGALYACGKLEAYKEWVLGLDLMDVAKLVDFSFTGTGMIRGDKVFAVIEEMVGDVMIEDLPIPFTAVATALIKQKEVWIQKGRLIDAIRASIAIPTVFTPKKIGDRYLIDGGVLNPLPIAPTLSDDTDCTIAVNLSSNVVNDYKIHIPEREREKENGIQETFFEMAKKAEELFAREKKSTFDEMGMFDIVGRTIDIMQNAILDCKMAGYSPDIMIAIPNNACGFYEFNKAYEMIELGRAIAKNDLEQIYSEHSKVVIEEKNDEKIDRIHGERVG
ncbi:MAG: patatin-like phospholipase family protein, partial [Campylobacterota bacterium]|nr:patatin-like phospholipase family protein [Campylobacterota bacterium]